ncbi:MAG TPA: hypothetical protein VGJ28_08475, partial [Micromonosporaceae bacterium]
MSQPSAGSSLKRLMGYGRRPASDGLDSGLPPLAAAAADAPHRRPSRFVLLGVLVALILGFSFAQPNSFPTEGNLNSILISQAVTLILAIGLLLALRAGDFDLSIAATMNFAAVIVAVLTTEHHVPLGLAVVIAILVSLLIGAING